MSTVAEMDPPVTAAPCANSDAHAADSGKDAASALAAYFSGNEWDNENKRVNGKECEGTTALIPVREDCSTKAHAIFEKAEQSIARGLPNCGDWMNAQELFFQAGALFATSGYPDEAASAFLHASIIMRSLNNEEEMSNALALAAENVHVLRPQLSVDILDKLVSMFTKANLNIQAARCRRDAAILLEQRLHEPARAIEMYREAINLFGVRPMTKSFTKHCIERICALTVELKEYTAASKLYIEESNFVTRGFPKTKQFLYSLLCMLAEGYGSDDRYFDALYYTRKRFDELQEEERDFQQGKEFKLMSSLINANDNGSLNKFDIAVFDYKSSSSAKPDSIFDALVEKCRSNLYEHME